MRCVFVCVHACEIIVVRMCSRVCCSRANVCVCVCSWCLLGVYLCVYTRENRYVAASSSVAAASCLPPPSGAAPPQSIQTDSRSSRDRFKPILYNPDNFGFSSKPCP
mmetsp:Transcript_26350/g.38776  ORF Transcript_26350/g.38776 Transcript_26350/m.38776 type:complete len:107 (+) Transcript_26350:126-446(+)